MTTLVVLLSTVVAGACGAKVLHLSDIHLDTLSDATQYGPDTFCRNPSDLPSAQRLRQTEAYWAQDFHYRTDRPYVQVAPVAPASAPFGQYLCDTTPALLNAVLGDAFGGATYDFVVITGDFVAHNQPNSSTTMYMFKSAVATIAGANANGVPVVPVVGNEDFYPDYNMDCKSREGRDHLYDLWSVLSTNGWIDSSQDQNFQTFGGLHVDVLQQNLRVVSVNSVLWSNRNDHTGFDHDPCGQFSWLDGTLGTAKSNGQRVWIAGHVPPSFNLWHSDYEATFMTIMKKYASIIDATMWGHTHSNSFFLDKNLPSLLGLITGSVTPNPVNPSYRVYNVTTRRSGEIVPSDFTQTYVDLHAVNAAGTFSTQPLFRYSTTFGADVSSASVKALHSKLLTDATFRRNYFNLEVSAYDNGAWDRIW
jgi:predicted phosphodiesterase